MHLRAVMTAALVAACSKPAAPVAVADARGVLTESNGQTVAVSSLYRDGCAVLTFYRGHF